MSAGHWFAIGVVVLLVVSCAWPFTIEKWKLNRLRRKHANDSISESGET